MGTVMSISILFSLTLFPFVILFLGLLGFLVAPFVIVAVNLLTGAHFARSSRVTGYAIIIVGLVITAYVCLAILGVTPWFGCLFVTFLVCF